MAYEETLPRFMKNMSAPQPPTSDIPEAAEPGGTLITAVRKLGLQLKPSTTVAKLIVIDHIEMPDEN